MEQNITNLTEDIYSPTYMNSPPGFFDDEGLKNLYEALMKDLVGTCYQQIEVLYHLLQQINSEDIYVALNEVVVGTGKSPSEKVANLFAFFIDLVKDENADPSTNEALKKLQVICSAPDSKSDSAPDPHLLLPLLYDLEDTVSKRHRVTEKFLTKN